MNIALRVFFWALFLVTQVAPTTEAQQAVTYQLDSTIFANPERGWMVQGPPFGATLRELTKESLLEERAKPHKPSVVRKYYVIDQYRDKPLPQSVLDEFRNDAEALREAGMKLVPRFAYGMGAYNDSKEDAPSDIILKHLDQLKPVLQENADIIATFQAGFIGPWGEWHSSSNNLVDNYTNELLDPAIKIRDKLLAVVPEHIMVSMRYMYWSKIKFYPQPLTSSQAYDPTSAQARIGYYHDATMSSSAWRAPSCGECPAYQDMLDYREQDTRFVVQNGEVCPTYDDRYLSDPRQELASVHFSLLVDEDCGSNFLQNWKDQGWYDDISRKLGYRLRLKKGEFPAQVVAGSLLRFELEIENVGYAAPYNRRGFELILRDASGSVHRLKLLSERNPTRDPRYWEPGIRTLPLSVKIPSIIPNGSYELLLNFPDPHHTLRDDPRYSIRLANKNTWEKTTGYNRLNASVEITDSNGGDSAMVDLSGTYRLRHVATGKYFDSDPRGKLVVRGNNQGLDQQWALVPIADGYYNIFSQFEGRGLVDADPNRVVVWNNQRPPVSAFGKQWKPEAVPGKSNTYRFKSRVANRGYLTVTDNRHINWNTGDKTSATEWKLEKVSSTKLSTGTPKKDLLATEASSSRIVVYPNPGTARFSITGLHQGASIKVHDAQGNLIKAFTKQGETAVQLNLQVYPAGLYFLSIEQGGQRTSQKIIKR